MVCADLGDTVPRFGLVDVLVCEVRCGPGDGAGELVVETAGVTVPDHRRNDHGQQDRTNQREERPGGGSTESHDANTEQAVSDGGPQRSDQQQVHQDEDDQRLEGAQSPLAKAVAHEPGGDHVADEPVHEDGNQSAPEPGERARAAIRHTESASWVVVRDQCARHPGPSSQEATSLRSTTSHRLRRRPLHVTPVKHWGVGAEIRPR